MVDLPLDAAVSYGIHTRVQDPAAARRLVGLMDDAGLDTLGVGDHLAFALPILDPFIQLTQIATLSERIRVATSVYLLPLRHPVPVAKQAATMDCVSGGRFVFGVGVGGEFPGEFAAAGIPVNERGARLDEAIDVVRKLWTGEEVSHEGRFFSFPPTRMLPAPVQPGGPPIWCGGRSDAAMRRAGRRLDGWIGYVLTPERYRENLEKIAREYAAAGRRTANYATAHLLFVRIADTYDEAFEAANRLLSERYAMDFTKATKRYVALGRPEDVAERIAAFREAGCRHFEFDFLGTPEERDEQIARFGREVRPLLPATS